MKLSTSAMITVALALLASRPVAATSTSEMRRIYQQRPIIRANRYLDFKLTLDQGRLRITRVRRGRLKKNQKIKRYAGPFAVRLYRSNQLIDVIYFAFPLTLGSSKADSGYHRALASQSRSRITVRVPWNQQLTHIVFVDSIRKTVLRYTLRHTAR